MSKIVKKMKIMQPGGTLSDYVPIGAEAENINVDGESVETKLGKKPYYYNTVADMKADVKLKAGDMAETLGYYEANDGGGATYKITDEESETDYQEELNNQLYATLIVEDYVTPEMFGARGDSITGDSDSIQTAINYLTNFSTTKTLKFSAKTYFINNTINLTRNIILKGSVKTMYNGNKATILKRNRNIKMLSLSGNNDWTIVTDNARASDIIISDLTLYTDSNEYYSEPLIYTKRAIYNHFDNLIFRGNGKAVLMDLSTFDSRFNNCDFIGDADIEIIDSYDTPTMSQMIHGVNQIYFYGCRFEGYSKGNVIKVGNYARELFFFGTKFEGTPSDTYPLIATKSNNADIYMYGVRVTMLEGSDSYFADLKGLSRSLFDVSYVDNSTTHTNPLIKIDNTSSITLLFKPSFNISNYGKDYYIENTNTNTYFDINSTLISLPYFANAKELYSNPELMNKTNTLMKNVYSTSSSSYSNSINMKIKKETETNYLNWDILPVFYNYGNNISQLVVRDPNGDACITLRNGSILSNKRLAIPYLESQPTSVSNGDILINNYTDTNTPNLTIGVGNSFKRIGWGTSAPSTGYWLKGNIVYNSEPAPGGVVGWICTATGTPGTWKSFGQISS